MSPSTIPACTSKIIRHDVESRRRKPARPVGACYAFGDEKDEIAEIFGPHCLKDDEYYVEKTYDNKRYFTLHLDEQAALKHLMDTASLPASIRSALPESNDVNTLIEAIQQQEQSPEVIQLIQMLAEISNKGLGKYVVDRFVSRCEPKYLYFDEYYQLTGHENIEALLEREKDGTFKPSDHPMLGLIRLARLNLTELLEPETTIALKSKLEGASNYLSRQILRYWSQNRHLRMTFDVRRGRPADPEGMRKGTNVWGGVVDQRHHVTTELGTRSRGFVWFFSFLAWYSDVKKRDEPLVLLLDEPGLTLHAKAQFDLLRYFEQELKPIFDSARRNWSAFGG
jgi:hypothetical protein